MVYGLLGLGILYNGSAWAESFLPALDDGIVEPSRDYHFLTGSPEGSSLVLEEAAYGVGATRWQVTASHVLPAAFLRF